MEWIVEAEDIDKIKDGLITGRFTIKEQLVNCKDCKYSSPNGVYGCRLERYNFNDESVRMYGEDYCSYGDRRTDEIN